MNIEKKLNELGYELTTIDESKFLYAGCVQTGNLIFLSGQVSSVNGVLPYTGVVGDNVSLEQAQQSAVHSTLNLLSVLKKHLGDLDKINRVVKVNGYVASTPQFTGQPAVINAASELLNQLFEPKHARAALGVVSLPGGAPVEIEMVVEI